MKPSQYSICTNNVLPSVYSTSVLSSNPLLVATWTCVSHSQWDGIIRDKWIHFREEYVPPNTWQDSLHWGREFFVPSFVLKLLNNFPDSYQVGSTISNWRSIHPGDWWGTGEYSMESSSWPAGTLSYMHQQGVMQVVIYTSCKQGKLQFDANTVNTCKAHRTLEARWGQHDISTCCISALSLWVTHQKQIW